MNKLEQGKIAAKDLAFLMTGFLSSVQLIGPGIQAGHDSWLAYMLGFAEGLLFAFLYILLSNRYQGKNLMEINELALGSFLGKFFSLCYLWYFFLLGSLVLRNFGDFFVNIIYPETPILVILIMITIICASAARNGIEVISRCSLVLVPLVFITTLSNTVMMLPEMNFTNLLPLFEAPLGKILLAAHNIATFPYGDSLAFLMILAFLQKPGQGKSSYLTGFLASFMLIFLTIIRNIATLGNTADIDIYPSYEAVRMINIAEIFTRMEVLVAANFLFLGFLKLSVLYYITALGTAQLLRLKSYLPLILPLGSLMISLSLILFESSVEIVSFATNIYPFYSLPFQLFLPGLTLLVSLLRRQSIKER